MKWILFAILIGVALSVFHRWMSRPIRHRITPDQFTRFINGLMVQFGHGGQLTIEPRGSPGAVKFAKDMESGSEPSLHFAVPSELWPTDQFGAIKRALIQRGIPVMERPLRPELPQIYLFVDHVDSVEAGAQLAKLVFEVAGLAGKRDFIAHYAGPLSWEELIRQIQQGRQTQQGSGRR